VYEVVIRRTLEHVCQKMQNPCMDEATLEKTDYMYTSTAYQIVRWDVNAAIKP